VRQDQGVRAAGGGQPARLTRGQVTVGRSQVGVVVGEGALGDEEVGTVGEVLRARARRGVHHEREALARTPFTDVLQPDPTEVAGVDELADVLTLDAGSGEHVGQHRPAIRLHELVAVGLDAMVQRPDEQAVRHLARGAVGVEAQVEGVPHDRDQVPHRLLPRCGEVQVDRVAHLVEPQPREHPGEAEAVVPVEVGEADAGDLVRGDTGEEHLPLGALARIEEDALPVPEQYVAVVVPRPGGHLGGGAEDHELAHGSKCAPVSCAGGRESVRIGGVRRGARGGVTELVARLVEGLAGGS